MIYLFLAIAFLLVLCIFLFMVSYKSLTLNRKYERFYNSTVEDISFISNSIDIIINRRPLLVDDPDVHRMIKGLRLVQEILNEYGHIKKINPESVSQTTSVKS